MNCSRTAARRFCTVPPVHIRLGLHRIGAPFFLNPVFYQAIAFGFFSFSSLGFINDFFRLTKAKTEALKRSPFIEQYDKLIDFSEKEGTEKDQRAKILGESKVFLKLNEETTPFYSTVKHKYLEIYIHGKILQAFTEEKKTNKLMKSDFYKRSSSLVLGALLLAQATHIIEQNGGLGYLKIDMLKEGWFVRSLERYEKISRSRATFIVLLLTILTHIYASKKGLDKLNLPEIIFTKDIEKEKIKQGHKTQ